MPCMRDLARAIRHTRVGYIKLLANHSIYCNGPLIMRVGRLQRQRILANLRELDKSPEDDTVDIDYKPVLDLSNLQGPAEFVRESHRRRGGYGMFKNSTAMQYTCGDRTTYVDSESVKLINKLHPVTTCCYCHNETCKSTFLFWAVNGQCVAGLSEVYVDDKDMIPINQFNHFATAMKLRA